MFVPPPHLLSGDIAHLLSNNRGRPRAHARLQKECLDLSSVPKTQLRTTLRLARLSRHSGRRRRLKSKGRCFSTRLAGARLISDQRPRQLCSTRGSGDLRAARGDRQERRDRCHGNGGGRADHAKHHSQPPRILHALTIARAHRRPRVTGAGPAGID